MGPMGPPWTPRGLPEWGGPGGNFWKVWISASWRPPPGGLRAPPACSGCPKTTRNRHHPPCPKRPSSRESPARPLTSPLIPSTILSDGVVHSGSFWRRAAGISMWFRCGPRAVLVRSWRDPGGPPLVYQEPTRIAENREKRAARTWIRPRSPISTAKITR